MTICPYDVIKADPIALFQPNTERLLLMSRKIFGCESYNYLLAPNIKAVKQNFTDVGSVFKKLQGSKKIHFVFFDNILFFR